MPQVLRGEAESLLLPLLLLGPQTITISLAFLFTSIHFSEPSGWLKTGIFSTGGDLISEGQGEHGGAYQGSCLVVLHWKRGSPREEPSLWSVPSWNELFGLGLGSISTVPGTALNASWNYCLHLGLSLVIWSLS